MHDTGYITRDSSGQQVRIQVLNNSFPRVVDWNEDGKKDLIIGAQYNAPPHTGNIYVYLNVGTNNAPSFGDYFLVNAGAGELYVPNSSPNVYDLDQDGKKDLIVGEVNGRIFFFKNIGTNSAPLFGAAYDTLKTVNGFEIYVGSYARPAITDWKNDGDPDLIVGNGEGYLSYYENSLDVEIRETACETKPTRLRVMPSPVSSQALIQYDLPYPGSVSLDIFTVDGRFVDRLINGQQEPGAHACVWQLREGFAPGIYVSRLKINQDSYLTKIAVIR